MSTRPIAATVPSSVDTRPRVTVLTGFSPAAVLAIAQCLLVVDPHLALVRHDISQIRDGRIRRTVRTADEALEDAVVELEHGCVSCTLREDVVPTLARLAAERPDGDILLALPQAVEPEAVAAACHQGVVNGTALSDIVRFDSYVAVVEAAAFLDDLCTSDDLRHRDLHAADNDHRSVAGVVARQVEFADTVVVWGSPYDEKYQTARLDALLAQLVPWSVRLRVADTASIDCVSLAARLRGTGRHDPRTPGMMGRALEGLPIGIHEPAGEHGATSVVFRSRRPFHPQRLHDALEQLTGEALRGRGQLWIASQSDTVIGWESAGGGISLGCLGYWLAALPHERWAETSDLRRLAADLDWDPYYGDRSTVLAFLGLGLNGDAISDLLASCLLTDAELADGFQTWTALPDPFAGFFPLTDETSPMRTDS
jgi:G3E family GTPase